MAAVSVFPDTKALTVTNLVVQAAMDVTVLISADVLPLHLLAVTQLLAPVSANQVLQDPTVTSHALLAHGV